jgi:hypothetical protein
MDAKIDIEQNIPDLDRVYTYVHIRNTLGTQ